MSQNTVHRIAQIGLPLGEGVTGVHSGTVYAFLKPCRPDTYVAANESVCGEIARFLGLPVPVGGLAHSGVAGQPAFYASVSFNLSSTSLPPVDAAALAADLPDVAAGIVVFDSLVANLDRHAKNLTYFARWKAVHLFDHSHALFGETSGQGIARLALMRDKLCLNLDRKTDVRYTRHCLGDHIIDASRFLPWFLAIAEMPESWLRRVISSAYGITPEEATAALSFLLFRRDNLREIFKANQTQFRNLRQGALL